MSNKTSVIWNYFTVNSVEIHKAHCNICKSIIVRGPANKPLKLIR